MDSIKKFFEKKKTDVKFVKAGQGKKLTAPSSSKQARPSSQPARRLDPSASAQKAGEAALSRFSSNKSNTEVDWSMQAIKAQARREMEAEKRLQELSLQEQSQGAAAAPAAELLEMQHVMFSCPLLGSDIGTYDTIKAGIREMLYAQLGEDKGVAACLIIHTCNKGLEKVKVCVETLCKYVENIVQQPSEEKFRRIRMSNRAYQERVKCLEGTQQFLEAAGFGQEKLPFGEGEEEFWVFPPDGDVERLRSLSDSLVCAEPVRPTLERSPTLLLPQQAARRPDLPPEFFTLSKEEIQKEAQLRKDAVEQSMVLRTKAMRERDNMREMRKYRFTLIRVRFADGLTMQATFRISEKLEAITTFIRGYLVNDWRPFFLCPSGGKKFLPEDHERSLAELYLVPTAVLNFVWDDDVSDPNLDDTVTLGPAAYDLLNPDDLEEPQL